MLVPDWPAVHDKGDAALIVAAGGESGAGAEAAMVAEAQAEAQLLSRAWRYELCLRPSGSFLRRTMDSLLCAATWWQEGGMEANDAAFWACHNPDVLGAMLAAVAVTVAVAVHYRVWRFGLHVFVGIVIVASLLTV